MADGSGISGASPGGELISAIVHAPHTIRPATMGAMMSTQTMFIRMDFTVMEDWWAMDEKDSGLPATARSPPMVVGPRPISSWPCRMPPSAPTTRITTDCRTSGSWRRIDWSLGDEKETGPLFDSYISEYDIFVTELNSEAESFAACRSDQFECEPELCADLDRVMRLPTPISDWDA